MFSLINNYDKKDETNLIFPDFYMFIVDFL